MIGWNCKIYMITVVKYIWLEYNNIRGEYCEKKQLYAAYG